VDAPLPPPLAETDLTPYCYCRQPSYGEMVGCDGPCEDWFHLTCVQIDKVPEGSFYCRNCQNAKRKISSLKPLKPQGLKKQKVKKSATSSQSNTPSNMLPTLHPKQYPVTPVHSSTFANPLAYNVLTPVAPVAPVTPISAQAHASGSMTPGSKIAPVRATPSLSNSPAITARSRLMPPPSTPAVTIGK
jgi:hypothetical protein